MVTIKLYQPEELVLNYFKSWGYKNVDELTRMTADFLRIHKDLTSADDLWKVFENESFKISERILGKTHLSKTSQIAYLKMLFLNSDVEGINIFGYLGAQEVEKLRKIFDNNVCQVAPTLAESPMIPQKIKIYKPLLPIKKWYRHFIKKVKSYVQK